MGAIEKHALATRELAGLRAGLAELKEDRRRLALAVALGQSSPDEWADVYRRGLEQAALVGDVTDITAELATDAERERVANKRAAIIEADQADAERRERIWHDMTNAARIFTECLRETSVGQKRLEHTQGRARLTPWSDDLATYIVPKGMITRTYGRDLPDWIVTNELGFRKWIHENAMSLTSPDEVAGMIARAKQDADRAGSVPAKTLIQTS